jgi:hypothetical protein
MRIAGLRSLIISIEIVPDRTNPCPRRPFRLLAQGRDSELYGLGLFHLTAIYNE